ncbi:MAG: hypothetical protein J6N53_11235 [Lachnospiraceae bacterium]|nr:hypothetical protein [Lachnospiraceae bacterium]
MNEQDCRAVENMALTGMELDRLYACFPKFHREEIERIYAATKIRTTEDGPADTLISVNCS